LGNKKIKTMKKIFRLYSFALITFILYIPFGSMYVLINDVFLKGDKNRN
jgi:hypothetical protein